MHVAPQILCTVYLSVSMCFICFYQFFSVFICFHFLYLFYLLYLLYLFLSGSNVFSESNILNAQILNL